MRLLCLGVLLVVVGCGGDGNGDTCNQPPSGLYQVSYSLQSGNCGPIQQSLTRLGDEAAGTINPGVSCMNFASPPTVGSCEVQMDAACFFQARSDLMMVMRGKIVWQSDVSSAKGPIYIEMRGAKGVPLCAGQYIMAYSRL